MVKVRGWGLGLVKVMFSESLERLNLNFNKPSVKSLYDDVLLFVPYKTCPKEICIKSVSLYSKIVL